MPAGGAAAPQLQGWRWYSGLAAVCFTAGAAMELFMIKTGFCESAAAATIPLARLRESLAREAAAAAAGLTAGLVAVPFSPQMTSGRSSLRSSVLPTLALMDLLTETRGSANPSTK
eukprot:SM000006S19489  [mRNA]  locus=s6:1083557:1084115:- [translate_table: standard]